MIREKAHFCKHILDNLPSKCRYESYMASFRPELEVCPCCGCKGNCKIHAYYNRYILDSRNGRPCCAMIRVMRVICSCGHTHAILPDFIVPYRQHSLKYLIQILLALYNRCRSVSWICDHFGLDPAFVYRLKSLYEEHKRLWLGSLKDICTTPLAFLQSLCRRPDIFDFLQDFYQRTSFSFLQSHRNPTANCDGCALGR